MSEATVEQTDDEAMASMMAGYNKTARGEEPPAVPTTEAASEPPAKTEGESEPPTPEPSDAEKLATDLADLKSKVASLQSNNDPQAVRKLHGEIGNINRTLKQLQQSKDAPADAELAAVLKDVDALGSDFEELAPALKAIKTLASKVQSLQPVTPPESEPAARFDPRQMAAIEALEEAHPDRKEVWGSQEFKAWLAAKPAEYQERFKTSWNPIVVSSGLTEYKESLKARQKKQERLAAAVTPQGTPAAAKPSTLPDEEGLWVGYNKGRKRLQA